MFSREPGLREGRDSDEISGNGILMRHFDNEFLGTDISFVSAALIRRVSESYSVDSKIRSQGEMEQDMQRMM